MALALLKRWVVDPQPRLVHKVLAETMGTAVFHFLGSLSPTPVANGIALIGIVFFTAKISGAHLNPAASLAFMILGHTNPAEMLFYWAAQIAGCAIGALWIAWLVPALYIRTDVREGASPNYSGCFVPDPNLSAVQIWGFEAAGTFCFLFPLYAIIFFSVSKSGYGYTGPIIIGLSLLATAMAIGPFTGAALNPARVLGSPIVFDCPNRANIAWYILGELAGSVAVTVCVIPYYGINAESWYLPYMPASWLTPAEPASPDEHSPIVQVPHAPLAPLQLGDVEMRLSPASASPPSSLEHKGSMVLVPATPGAAAMAAAGVSEVRYTCLVPGATRRATSSSSPLDQPSRYSVPGARARTSIEEQAAA